MTFIEYNIPRRRFRNRTLVFVVGDTVDFDGTQYNVHPAIGITYYMHCVVQSTIISFRQCITHTIDSWHLENNGKMLFGNRKFIPIGLACPCKVINAFCSLSLYILY